MFRRLVTSLGLGAAVIAAPIPSAVADPCPDIELVFARGTGEPPGMGRVDDALVATLAPLLDGRTLGTYAVNYPASLNFLTTSAGADDARGHIAWTAGACPGTRIVLGGFSQGAAVVSCWPACRPLATGSGPSARLRRWPRI